MTLLDYTYELFRGVKEKEYSFSNALNKKIQEMSLTSLEVNTVKACLKGVINRYYYLKFEIRKAYGNVEDKIFDYLILGLSYVRYVGHVSVGDVINFIKESEEVSLKELDLEKLEEVYYSLKDNVTPIPEKYENNFSKKVSILYSYPEWLVGMMKKHFGGKNAYKSIASSRRNTPINVSINPASSLEEIEDHNFKKIEGTSSSYEYLGKSPLIENPLFKERKILVMDAMEQVLVDNLDVNQGDEVLVVGDNKSTLLSNVALRMYNFGKVYYACSNQDSYFSARKSLDQYRIKNVIPFEGDVNLVCTHVKENSLDRVLLIPQNSEFGLIRRKPEIVINFKQNDLDSLIENQGKALEEVSKFVKEDGVLVYAVPTLNIKESFNIIRIFSENHPEFVIEKEEMIFPYVNQTTGMYYAKLRKQTNDLEESKEC